MYVFVHIVFIIWSPKLLSSSVIPGFYRYDNMSMHINHSSNHEPQNAVLGEMDCILKSCLQKCCPSSQIFSYVKRQCFSPPEEQLSTITTRWTIDFPQFNILDNFTCQWQNTIILNKSRGEEYRLDANGILHESLRNLNHNLSTFCLEFISEDATFMPIIHLDDLLNDGEDEKWRFMFYAYGMSLSNLFLVITLGLYISTPALHRSVQDKSFSCYVISLIFGFSFLMAAQNIHKVNPFCTVIAYMTQFWLLARFFWLNIMCIDIRHAVNTSKLIDQSSKRKFSSYCWYAWGCPLLVSFSTFLSERLLTNDLWRPGLGEDDCWFRKYSGHYLLDPKFLYFYSVTSVTLIINFCMFSDTALMILSRNRKWKPEHPDSRRHKQQQKRFSVHLKLFIVMGLNWILDVASYYANPNGMADLWFIMDMFNSLQGVFTFSIFVCNKKVIRLLEKRFFPRRTFSKEYGSLRSNRNVNSISKQWRTSSLQKDMDINTVAGKT